MAHVVPWMAWYDLCEGPRLARAYRRLRARKAFPDLQSTQNHGLQLQYNTKGSKAIMLNSVEVQINIVFVVFGTSSTCSWCVEGSPSNASDPLKLRMTPYPTGTCMKPKRCLCRDFARACVFGMRALFSG